MLHKSSLIFITLILLNSPHLIAQVTDDILREVLQDELQTNQTDDETGYLSFTQNELKNTVKQLKTVDDEIERDLFRSKLSQDRIELASKLCAKDPRACYLIDKYQSYKWSEGDLNKKIELFGLDIFSGYPMSFDVIDESSLGANYVVRVGDKLRIFISGMRNIDTEIQVQNSGDIILPSFGSVNVAGLSLDLANKIANEFVATKDIGSQVFLSLTQVKTNQIFVLGMINNPGSYLLNALGSSVNGIISAGGFKNNASLRSIGVFRNGELVKEIDLYDLLIFGSTNTEIDLESGDVLLVNALKEKIKIEGEVYRPALYEIKDGDTFQDALNFALGLTPDANKENISLKRKTDDGDYELINLNAKSDLVLKSGDEIIVHTVSGTLKNVVSIEGAIKKSGRYSFGDEITLGNLININNDILDETYLGYAVVKRYDKLTKGWSYTSFNLYNQAKLDEIKLRDRDKIFIFSNNEIDFLNSSFLKDFMFVQSRISIDDETIPSGELYSYDEERLSSSECLNYFRKQKNNMIVKSILKKLSVFGSSISSECTDLLNRYSELTPLLYTASIPVMGNIINPGLYPISPGVKRQEVIAAAGGALLPSTEITTEVGVDQRFAETLLTFVNVKLNDTFDKQGFVTLAGEFKNPGIYPINRGETILNVVTRAGGYTNEAYPLGGIFTRESLKLEEERILQRAEAEISNILSNAVASGYLKQSSTDLVALVELMSSVGSAEATGRLITELNVTALKEKPHLNIQVLSGDTIYVPRISNTISISGQVLNPVVVPYVNNLSFKDYLKKAGGVKDNGDMGKAFAILPNGETLRLETGLLGFRSLNERLLPGSVIYIPRKQRPLDSLALVETISPIVASLSVTAASIAAISNNN